MHVMHDRVLIKKNEPETTSAGGIFIAVAQDQKAEATVIAVGSGKPVKGSAPIPLTVKVGDKVLYNASATVALVINGENLMVIKEEEIYAILDEDDGQSN